MQNRSFNPAYIYMFYLLFLVIIVIIIAIIVLYSFERSLSFEVIETVMDH